MPTAKPPKAAARPAPAAGYFGPGLFKFLRALARNNNREWFQANKATFDAECQQPLERLAADLLVALSAFDPTYTQFRPKDLVFRIYRDTRFSPDKTPYKTHLSLAASPGGRKSALPGLYVHIGVDEFAAYAGVYAPEPQQLFKIRQEILYHHAELQQVLRASAFKRLWGPVLGEALSRAPKDFSPEDVAEMPLLKQKQFYVASALEPALLTGPGLVEALMQRYRTVEPFNAFFRRAIQD